MFIFAPNGIIAAIFQEKYFLYGKDAKPKPFNTCSTTLGCGESCIFTVITLNQLNFIKGTQRRRKHVDSRV
jgi:hypothetical protein